MNKVAIIGTTTWGTTLGIILARKSVPVTLLTRTPSESQKLQAEGQNSRFLSGIRFPANLTVSSDPEQSLDGAGMVILAVPSSSFRGNIKWIQRAISDSPILLSASKGLERDTGNRMSQIMEEELPSRLHSSIAVLSGPNLAMEILKGKPASTVVASRNIAVAEAAQEVLMSSTFRVYTNDDTVGVELGGALKNIIAIGAGICDGMGYGDNGKAAFITRGLAEITRLGVAAGASPITFAGLAGLGDLITTCASSLSRNHFVGRELAAGKTLSDILASMKNVAEGVYTTVAALRLAERLEVDMPITRATYQILYEHLDLVQAVAELMGRPPRAEWEGLG